MYYESRTRKNTGTPEYKNTRIHKYKNGYQHTGKNTSTKNLAKIVTRREL